MLLRPGRHMDCVGIIPSARKIEMNNKKSELGGCG